MTVNVVATIFCICSFSVIDRDVDLEVRIEIQQCYNLLLHVSGCCLHYLFLAIDSSENVNYSL